MASYYPEPDDVGIGYCAGGCGTLMRNDSEYFDGYCLRCVQGGCEPDDDDGCEPIGSCENCEINLYPDDDYEGLCGQCYWLSQQGGGA